jgi:hypothetical protein
MTTTELIAEMATRRGSKPSHGSDGKIPPQGGSVNTPQPPQDTPSKKKVCRFVYRGEGKPNPVPEEAFNSNDLPWQPGPACGGGLPPESALVVVLDYGDYFECREKNKKDLSWNYFLDSYVFEKWLVIK